MHLNRHFAFAAALVLVVFSAEQVARAADKPDYARMTWRSVGPAVAGGRVPGVAGTAANPKLYYLATAGGGIWKSANGGETWEAVFENQHVSAVGAIAIDPSDETVVWAGTGEANPRNDVSYGDGIYKTIDGGKTWKNMGLQATRHISRIAIDPKNPNHVVVAAQGDVFKDSTDRGVYVTTDGGTTWQKTLYVGPQSGASDLAMAADDPNIIYAGIWQFQRIPWTFHSGGPDDGLYKSVDGGMTWNKLTGHGLPEGTTGRIGLAIAPSDSKRVYALIEAKGGILWRTDDGGATWTMTSNDTLVDQRPFYFSHINVDPKNPDHVYAVSEMLAESKDGGKKFKEIATGVHVDYHAMWIAPNDPDRMITGEDGGYALTLDGGKHWSFARNLAIGQVYHVGVSNENPYWVCAPLQDNNGFCGPSNSLDRGGIKDEHWLRTTGGDGMWGVPDPSDPNIVMVDSQTGNISQFNKATRQNRSVTPYFDFDRNNFDLYKRKYRFNWDSPIAFAPWNPHMLWIGGSVVLQSMDRGLHWRAISPDLTLNLKEHQTSPGGPLALDVSSAENSDTILDIEGSSVATNQIWVGTDDGIVALTRDGGAHWSKNTLPAPPFGRVETVAPSPFDAATAYAIVDRHRSGDYAPYLFVTHSYGTSWTKLTSGLPADQYVRTVRPDTRNRKLLYAGTENGLWFSYDNGAHWTDFKLNLPTVSVRDIRIVPEFNDLAIATHGRALWIMDDITALQDLPQGQARGSMLFAIRPAYQYSYHSEDEGAYTRFSGKNPPAGAIIDFYQAKPGANAPEIAILDAHGRVIRHIKNAKLEPGGDAEPKLPDVPNLAGLNRVVWDFREDGVTRWMGAAKPEYRGSLTGVVVLPGKYAARMTIAGHTYTQPFVVLPNPKAPYQPRSARAAYDYAKKYLAVSGQINTVLNNLDAQKKSLDAADTALSAAGNTALAAKVAAALQARATIFSRFTADYHNDEDSIQKPGALREDIPRGGFGAPTAPTDAVLEYARRFDREYAAAMSAYNSYVRTTLTPLASDLKAVHQKGIDGTLTVLP